MKAASVMSRPYEILEQRLNHVFADVSFCEVALTHKSWVNETTEPGRDDNEKLEFLGDSVLSIVVSDLLMTLHPDYPEGILSKVRAAVVSERGLADVAGGMDLGQWIFLGKGEEQAGGRVKPSILADTLEAVIGAVYRDGGFGRAFEVVKGLFESRLADAEAQATKDYKSRMQEVCQAHFKMAPTYQMVASSGPEHEKTFEIAVFVKGEEYGRASGRSKKAAQQAAAAHALKRLEDEVGPE